MSRPTRQNPVPLVPLEARSAEELAHAVAIIYAGGLADGRALYGAAGVYTVNAVEPLEVTDDGLAINLHDERWSVMLHGRCSNETPTEVDPLAEEGAAGSAATPSRGDHRHAHAPLADPADLAVSLPFIAATAATWDSTTATLTLLRDRHELLHDTAGHGTLVNGDPASDALGIGLTGLVNEVTDGATAVHPCRKIEFVSGDGATVTVTEPENKVAQVTVTSHASSSAEDVYIASLDDGTTTVAPCRSLTFTGGTGISATLSDDGGESATLTLAATDPNPAAVTHLALHYEGDNDLNDVVVDAGDWTGRRLVVWGRLSETTAADLAANPTAAARRVWMGAAGATEVLELSAPMPDVQVQLFVDTADGGKLKYDLTNHTPGSAEAWVDLYILDYGDVASSGFSDIGNGL